MDETQTGSGTSAALDSLVERFAKEFVAERVDGGYVNLRTVGFREVEQLSHEIGQRVARQLGGQITAGQCGELYADDYNCPVCGLDCEAIEKTRTVETIDGPAEIVELKSFCPKCRRNFFPCARDQRPR